MENTLKGFVNDRHAISCVPPPEYAKRFYNYVETTVFPDPEPRPRTTVVRIELPLCLKSTSSHFTLRYNEKTTLAELKKKVIHSLLIN